MPQKHTRAYLKVQDGCNQYCSYCIIPYVRGSLKSRGIEDAAVEAAGMAQQGIHEIVLTGIHLSSYGVDFSGGSILWSWGEASAVPAERDFWDKGD